MEMYSLLLLSWEGVIQTIAKDEFVTTFEGLV
jgi:hypothetical protein